jgi:hypothetical protein
MKKVIQTFEMKTYRIEMEKKHYSILISILRRRTIEMKNANCSNHILIALGPHLFGFHSIIALPKAREPTLWETPNAPGRAPATTDGAAAQISAARHVWEEDVKTYRTYTSVQQALKKQIISVLEPMYLDILNGNIVGYANISERYMLDHLF